MQIDNLIKQVAFLQTSSNLSATDWKLAQKMAKELPIDFSNPNLKICDFSYGKGTILLAVIAELLEYHSKEHIANNMIYGYDIDYSQYRIAQKAIT